MSERRITKIIGLILLLAAVLEGMAFAGDLKGPSNILLSWTDDPSETITVVWCDDGEKNEVIQLVTKAQYGETGFSSTIEFAASCKDVSLDSSGAWHYEATATGLAPSTEYVYRVGSEEAWSGARSFTTADPASDTLTFAYMGDVQTAGDTASDYALWGGLIEDMYKRSPELSFAVLGGDNVNSGISLEEFELFSENAGKVFSFVPLFSAVGNHESNFPGGKAELFLDYFAFPQNGPEGFSEEFYSFDVANCHILVLNSWIFSGEQKLTEEDYERVNAWIASDLASSRADWQIVVTHVPVYAVHSDSTAAKVKEQWAPIFEEYGADLVLEGHQHVYSRSRPMYQGKTDYENGITYVMGVSGSKYYDSADETFAERTVYGVANYQLVRSDGDTLTVQTLDADGNELDFFTVMQRGVSATRADYIETLWRAAGAPASEGGSPFYDTSSPAVIWAYEKGMVIGCGDGSFKPNAPITDWQIGLILERISKLQ